MSRRALLGGVLTVLAALLTNCVGTPVPISPDIIRTAPAKTRLNTPLLDVPFESVRGIPLLEVRINGQGPFRVLLDTGAEAAAVLAPRVVRQLALPDEGTAWITGAAGETLKRGVRVRRVQRLEIGGGEFRDFRVLEMDLSKLRIDGLLGFTLFSDYLLTIDYPDRRVRITRGALPDPDGREYLALTPGRGVPVTLLAFGSAPMAAVIDSAATERVYVPLDAVRRLPFSHGPVEGVLTRTAGTEDRQRMGRLGLDVALGQHVFERPIVQIQGDKARIGARALAPFVVTFDQRRDVVRFARAATGPILSPPLRSLGVTTMAGSRGLLVNDVIPGTPAASLDIRRGDRILALEGVTVEHLSSETVSRMIEEKNELVLLLLRNNRRVEVHVPVVDLVP